MGLHTDIKDTNDNDHNDDDRKGNSALGLDRSQRFFVRTSRISAKAMKMAVTTMMRRRRTTTTMMMAPITPTVMTNFDTSG
mgnify:CR=1 FL=1